MESLGVELKDQLLKKKEINISELEGVEGPNLELVGTGSSNILKSSTNVTDLVYLEILGGGLSKSKSCQGTKTG
jgi:hypothetical protein